jgi:hypothetical protein
LGALPHLLVPVSSEQSTEEISTNTCDTTTFLASSTHPRCRNNPVSHSRERETLQVHRARPGERRKKDSLPTEKGILKSADKPNIVANALFKCDKTPGIDP